jgi:hypothetical protein
MTLTAMPAETAPTQVFVFEVAYFRRREPVQVRIRDHSYAAAERRVKQMHPLSQITYLGDEDRGGTVHRHLAVGETAVLKT